MFITMRSQFVQRFFPGVNTPIRYNYLLEQIRNNFAFTFTFINNFMEMCYLKHVNPTIFSGRNTTVSRPEVGQSSLITGRVCVLRLCRSTGGNKTGSSFKASAMICSFVWVVANPAKRNGRQKHGHQHFDNQHNVHVSQLESCSNGNGPCRRSDNRRQKMRSLFE